MRPLYPATCVLVADDLTGAADACVTFVGQGYDGVVLLDAGLRGDALVERPEPYVVAVDTDTRRRSPDEAGSRVRAAAQRTAGAPDTVCFKKIDSSLRGHVGREVMAALDAWRCTHALLTPALPALGRTVRHGWLCVESPGDPAPRDIRALLAGDGIADAVALACPEGETQQAASTLARSLAATRAAGTRVVILDAESSRDLEVIVEAGTRAGGRPLWVGSAGLAGALAVRLASRDRPAPQRRDAPTGHGRVVLCIGSTHPVTEMQVAWLSRSPPGVPCTLLRPTPDADLPALVAAALETARPGEIAGLVLSGGDTAAAVCAILGATALHLRGEIAVGVPWGRLVEGRCDGVPVVLKSGAFGADDVLSSAVRFLSTGSS